MSELRKAAEGSLNTLSSIMLMLEHADKTIRQNLMLNQITHTEMRIRLEELHIKVHMVDESMQKLRQALAATEQKRSSVWTDEARKAVDELEEKYGIEVVSIEHHEKVYNMLTATEKALATEQSEPVATVNQDGSVDWDGYFSVRDYEGSVPLYTHPPKQSEPVVIGKAIDVLKMSVIESLDLSSHTLIYTHPPRREALSDEELDALWKAYQVGQISADHTDKEVFKEVIRLNCVKGGE